MLEVFREILAGASSGVLGTVIGFPLDTIKVHMQMKNDSTLQSTKSIYAEGGILRFYKGVGSPLVSLTVLNTLNFSLYYRFCKWFEIEDKKSIGDNKSFEPLYGIAAACVGPFSSCISTPFELIKTQMQLSQNLKGIEKESFNNSFSACRYIVRTHGIHTLFKGHICNTIREVVFLSTYFITYEHIKDYLHRAYEKVLPSQVSIPVAGGLAGALGWFISFPFDCVKSQIQGTHLKVKSAATITVFKELLQTRGITGLYSGIQPSIMRAFLVSSTRFSAYEGTLWLIDKILKK